MMPTIHPSRTPRSKTTAPSQTSPEFPTASLSETPTTTQYTVEENICPMGYTGTGCGDCCDASHLYLFVEGEGVQVNSECLRNDSSDMNVKLQRYYGRNGMCIRCPSLVHSMMIGLPSGFFLIWIFVTRIFLQKSTPALLNIIIDFFQCLSLLGTVSVPWPSVLQKTFAAMLVFNFDMDAVAPPDCSFEYVSYQDKVVALLSIPFFLGLILAGISWIFVGMKKLFSISTYGRTFYHMHTAVGLMTMLLYFAYLKLSMVAAEALGCAFYEVKKEDQLNTAFLRHMDWLCSSHQVSNGTMTTAAGTSAFLLYTLGFPVIMAMILLREKARLRIQEDLTLRLKDIENRNPLSLKYRRCYGSLYCIYEPRFWYWSLVVLFRKFLLSISASFINNNSTLEMIILAFIFFFSGIAQYRCRPYLRTAKEMRDTAFSEENNIGDMIGSAGEYPKKGRFQIIRSFIKSHNNLDVILHGTLCCLSLFGMLISESEGAENLARSTGAAAITVTTASIFLLIGAVLSESFVMLPTTPKTDYTKNVDQSIFISNEDKNIKKQKYDGKNDRAEGGEKEVGRVDRHMAPKIALASNSQIPPQQVTECHTQTHQIHVGGQDFQMKSHQDSESQSEMHKLRSEETESSTASKQVAESQMQTQQMHGMKAKWQNLPQKSAECGRLHNSDLQTSEPHPVAKNDTHSESRKDNSAVGETPRNPRQHKSQIRWSRVLSPFTGRNKKEKWDSISNASLIDISKMKGLSHVIDQRLPPSLCRGVQKRRTGASVHSCFERNGSEYSDMSYSSDESNTPNTFNLGIDREGKKKSSGSDNNSVTPWTEIVPNLKFGEFQIKEPIDKFDDFDVVDYLLDVRSAN